MAIVEATFVLSLRNASDSTYQTWVSVRLLECGTIERKSNAGGNGQTWEVFGYVSAGDTQLFTTNAKEAEQARILAHFCAIAARKCNVKGYGAAWSNAEWVPPVVNARTKRKLTAAPSIREGSPPRDKNVKARRWHGVNVADMHARIQNRK